MALQLVLVALVIAFPRQVTMFLDKPERIDLDKVRIEIPAEEDARPEGSSAEELQRALGGKAPAPDEAKKPGQDGKVPPPPPPSEEEKAAAEIQRMLERR